jgi:hypothetical protein
MTKAEIAVELDRVRAENEALRDLLAAVRETAVAGANNYGDGVHYYRPGWYATIRIECWLQDVPGADAKDLRSITAMFRKHAADIAVTETVTVS